MPSALWLVPSGLANVASVTGSDVETCFVAFTKCELQDLTEEMKVWFVMVRVLAC